MRIHVGEAHHDGNGHWVIQKTIEHDGGNIEEGVFIFPEDALEWRAAEYGIDPQDRDTLFDMIIAEFFILADDGTGPSLYDAENTDDARVAHLERITRAKLRHRISTRGKNHPSVAVKGEFLMDEEALDLKRQIVNQHRERVHNQRKQHLMSLVSDERRTKRLDDLRRTLRGE